MQCKKLEITNRDKNRLLNGELFSAQRRSSFFAHFSARSARAALSIVVLRTIDSGGEKVRSECV